MNTKQKLALVQEMTTEAIERIVNQPRPAHLEVASPEYPVAGKVRIEGIGDVELKDLRAELTRRQLAMIHKAEPNTALQREVGVGYCKVCGQRAHRVPGGQGSTWVHTDTGTVAAPSPPAQDES